MNQWLANKLKGFGQVWAFDNRWHLILQRVLFPRDTLMFYRLGDLEVLVDHAGGDANGAREVLTTRMYTDHLAQIPQEHPWTVLDVGANNGGFVLLLNRLGIPLKRIVCVELNPRTCMRLRFNLDRNIEAAHEVLNAGLSGRSGTLTLELGEGSVGDSIYMQHTDDEKPRVLVRLTTFDEIVAEYFAPETMLDVCKIDIEHAEYEVFASPGHDTIERCRFLIMEIHRGDGEDPQDVVRQIAARGFELLPRGADPDVYAFRNTRSGQDRVGR